MTKIPRRFLEITIAVVAALLFALLLQAEWFHAFSVAHPAIRTTVALFVFPAMMMAFSIGGHAASGQELAIGLVAQFLLIFCAAHLLKRAYLKLEASMACVTRFQIQPEEPALSALDAPGQPPARELSVAVQRRRRRMTAP